MTGLGPRDTWAGQYALEFTLGQLCIWFRFLDISLIVSVLRLSKQ